MERNRSMAIKAIQQIMLGSVTGNEKATKATLNQIKQAGYDGIELNGFMIRKTPFLVRILTRAAGMPTGGGGNIDWKSLVLQAGLKVTSIHEDLGSIERNPEEVIRNAEEFGTDYIVITGMYRFDYSDEKAWGEVHKRLNTAGKNLKEGGVKLLYHNHNCEFQKVTPSKMAYQFLLEETDPEYVNFELDTYWIAEAGICPLGIMKQLGNRMKLYHINDRGTRLKGVSMTPILKSDSMELGYGNMNLQALTEYALGVNVDAIILESHKNWIDKSPIASLKTSAKFMNQYVE